MAAGVAHELNNPLTLIREAAGWLHDLLDPDENEEPDREEIRKVLTRIDAYIERARGITHRMLGFGRRMEPVKEHVNANALVDETVAFLENEALHRNITIERSLDSALPPVRIDPSQVQQVFLNLLDNAIDAVGHDGTIRIRTQVAPTAGFAQIDFMDSGPGIPPQIIDKIFDPFFTTKAAGEGTGLGLAISYGIVEKMGGNIRVESSPETGTTFSVLLPLAETA
jgi:two-component system NtrC family sensor kinase